MFFSFWKIIMSHSPYENSSISQWESITEDIIQKFPVPIDILKFIVLESWESILKTKIGINDFVIGKDIFPKPQIMGFFLHELIPLELKARFPKDWRGELNSNDKDIVYIPNEYYSIEIKTSSSPKNIFGNRSYAHEGDSQKKSKSGFYLAINFQKFKKLKKSPKVVLIRFGWIDHTDWIGQAASTGQQARLSKEVETKKLKVIYSI